MKNKIQLTESDLKQMVNEAVRRIVAEISGTFDDTTSAPWNQDVKEPYKMKENMSEYYMDLSPLIEAHPELKRLLKPMVVSDWDECNIGPVDISYDYTEPSEYDTIGPEEDPVSNVEVHMAETNKYKQLLPDRLVDMIDELATEQFDVSDLKKNSSPLNEEDGIGMRKYYPGLVIYYPETGEFGSDMGYEFDGAENCVSESQDEVTMDILRYFATDYQDDKGDFEDGSFPVYYVALYGADEDTPAGGTFYMSDMDREYRSDVKRALDNRFGLSRIGVHLV